MICQPTSKVKWEPFVLVLTSGPGLGVVLWASLALARLFGITGSIAERVRTVAGRDELQGCAGHTSKPVANVG